MTTHAMPRIELHLHLEGGAPADFIRGLAAEQGVDLGRIFTGEGSYACRDFTRLRRVQAATTSVLTSPEAYHRLTRAVLAESAAHGVIYTEAFLSPDACGNGDPVAWQEYLAAIQDAAARAQAQDGITLRGIVTAHRHFGLDRAKAVALCAAETAGSFVRGFGIAGDGMAGKLRDFAWGFDCAREAGLHLTAHAGERGGAPSVWEALQILRVERIGHGVQAIDDPALVDHLAESGTVLECCPGADIALGLCPDWPGHPINQLRTAGVKVTVSTDAPPFFHTTMTVEYDRLAKTFGWDAAVFADITQTALHAAFCDKDTRAALARKLEA